MKLELNTMLSVVAGSIRSRKSGDMLSLLRLIENPLDDVAMASVLRSPMVAVSDDTLWWLTRESRSESEDDEEDTDETDIPARNRNIGKLYAGICTLDKLFGDIFG